MEKELPKGWKEVLLGDICSKPQYGWTTKSKPTGSFKYLRTTDISDGKIDWESVPYCEDIPEDKEKYLLRENDIVVSRAGSVGISFRLDEIPQPTFFASYLIRFLPIEVEPKLVEYFLKTDDFWHAISNMSAGIAVQNVNATKLSNLTIPLPPIPEQKRIVTKLDTLFAILNNTRARLEKIPQLLKNFRQAVLTQAVTGKLTEEWRDGKELENLDEQIFFLKNKRLNQANTNKQVSRVNEIFNYQEAGNHFEIPKFWTFLSLDKIVDFLSYGTSAKSLDEGSVPVLRMGNLQGGRLKWDDLKYSSDPKEIEKYKLKEGDLLFNRTNSPELVGKTAIYLGEKPAIYAGYLIKIPRNEFFNSHYLNYVFNSDYAKKWCWFVKSDGVSQSNINAQKLSKFEVPFPPLKEQKEIVRRVESLFAKADAIEQQYERLKQKIDALPQALLAKAFRGELVEQNPLDEPASELLKRIRAEKEKMTTKSQKRNMKRKSNVAAEPQSKYGKK